MVRLHGIGKCCLLVCRQRRKQRVHMRLVLGAQLRHCGHQHVARRAGDLGMHSSSPKRLNHGRHRLGHILCGGVRCRAGQVRSHSHCQNSTPTKPKFTNHMPGGCTSMGMGSTSRCQRQATQAVCTPLFPADPLTCHQLAQCTVRHVRLPPVLPGGQGRAVNGQHSAQGHQPTAVGW